MSPPAERIDPTDIAHINERLRVWASPQETILPVTISRVVIADDARTELIEIAAENCRQGTALLVYDETLIQRGGSDLKNLLHDALGRRLNVVVRKFASRDTRIETARRLAGELGPYAALISVGSGSITDLAKYARHLHAEDVGRTIPFISFPTAASMTAYSSSLAVITVDGVKRTLPASAPDAVVCDLPTLAEAPVQMTRAGFGDVLARSVSYGDWYLAWQLGMDDSFSEVPGMLLQHAEQAMIEDAEKIGAGELEGVRRLMEALLLAGMAMSIVNQTAPLSGWEHAMSHYLDLTAATDGRCAGLHGAQVGVTTLVSARAYERIWVQLDFSLLDRAIEDRSYRTTIEQRFGGQGHGGKLVAELWNDLEKKLSRWRSAQAARQRFVERGRRGEIDDFIRSRVGTSDHIRAALQRAGAAAEFSALQPAVSEQAATNMILESNLIRARFTLGDLLSICGRLTRETALDLLH